MGIVSGIVAVVGGMAKAFTPKQEPPTPEPVQIMIVDGKQKTHREQVQEWLGGGDPPEKVQRIHRNIQRIHQNFAQALSALETGSPEEAKGIRRHEQRERYQRSQYRQEQENRQTRQPMDFNAFGGQQTIREKPVILAKSTKKGRKPRRERRTQKNNWNINFGRWKL